MGTIIKYSVFLIIYWSVFSLDASSQNSYQDMGADEKIYTRNLKQDDFLPGDESLDKSFKLHLLYSQDISQNACWKKDGISPFCISMSSYYHDMESLEELLSILRRQLEGADKDECRYGRNDVGQILYHLAVIHDSVNIVNSLLLEAIYTFDDPRLKDYYGRIPVYYVESLEMISLLNDQGAVGVNGDEIMDLTVARDNENKTILHALVERGVSMGIIEYIIQRNLVNLDTINALDIYGKTALDYALNQNQRDELRAIFSAKL